MPVHRSALRFPLLAGVLLLASISAAAQPQAAHLAFPGIGHMVAEDKGFHWVPVVYGPYQRASQVPFIQ
ncbi:hypothetical protein [Pseudomonas sp. Q1-7]|uniref:hypothetical protein n=1 Tax=Pseudomonas sp. Q1-7 TaxID=3020843 RepID=UPI003FA6BD3E